MDIIAAVGFIATFLGVCIAISAYFNGKHIKEGVREMERVLERIDEKAEERHMELLRLFGELFKRVPEVQS